MGNDRIADQSWVILERDSNFKGAHSDAIVVHGLRNVSIVRSPLLDGLDGFRDILRADIEHVEIKVLLSYSRIR